MFKTPNKSNRSSPQHSRSSTTSHPTKRQRHTKPQLRTPLSTSQYKIHTLAKPTFNTTSHLPTQQYNHTQSSPLTHITPHHSFNHIHSSSSSFFVKSFRTMSTQQQQDTTTPTEQPQQQHGQRHNLTPEEIAAKREERKKKQEEQRAKKGTQPQQQQSAPKSSTKKQTSSDRDYPSVYKTAFPSDTYEYVDTHVHIDAILGRLNRGAAVRENKGCCGETVETTTETTTTTPEQTEQTTTTPTPSTALQWTVDKLNNEAHLGNFGGAVTVCCEPETYDDAMAVLENDKSGKIYGAFGIHPHEASKWNDEIQALFEKAMSHPKVVAWGECGLDYYYDNSPREIQRECFIKQIQLAVKHNKPLVVHTREAEEDTVEIMLKHCPKEHFVHIHCCTSSKDMVKPLLENFPNLFIGFTGCITFKNNDSIIETLSNVPIERLLLETDGPYMAPLPFRGAVAHSGMIPFTAVRMAQVKEVELDVLMTQVRENTKKIYGF